VKEEPEKIKKWREEQKARLEEKGKYAIIISILYFISFNNWILFRCRRRKKEGRMENNCQERIGGLV
jgi:hypothetical protein